MKYPARFIQFLFVIIIVCGLVVLVRKESVEAVTPISVVINEVAWAGTTSGTTGTNDEWIELYNFSNTPWDLNGWVIKTNDEGINEILSGIIPAGGYYLLERTDDMVVYDSSADFIYSGSFSNDGEVLELYDGSGILIDTANSNG